MLAVCDEGMPALGASLPSSLTGLKIGGLGTWLVSNICSRGSYRFFNYPYLLGPFATAANLVMLLCLSIDSAWRKPRYQQGS